MIILERPYVGGIASQQHLAVVILAISKGWFPENRSLLSDNFLSINLVNGAIDYLVKEYPEEYVVS